MLYLLEERSIQEGLSQKRGQWRFYSDYSILDEGSYESIGTLVVSSLES